MDVGLFLWLLMLSVQGAVICSSLFLKDCRIRTAFLLNTGGSSGGHEYIFPLLLLSSSWAVAFLASPRFPVGCITQQFWGGNFISLIKSLASTSNRIGNLILEACTAFVINPVFQDSWIYTTLQKRLIQEMCRTGCKNT